MVSCASCSPVRRYTGSQRCCSRSATPAG